MYRTWITRLLTINDTDNYKVFIICCSISYGNLASSHNLKYLMTCKNINTIHEIKKATTEIRVACTWSLKHYTFAAYDLLVSTTNYNIINAKSCQWTVTCLCSKNCVLPCRAPVRGEGGGACLALFYCVWAMWCLLI
jgi:hypothetical protein